MCQFSGYGLRLVAPSIGLHVQSCGNAVATLGQHWTISPFSKDQYLLLHTIDNTHTFLKANE